MKNNFKNKINSLSHFKVGLFFAFVLFSSLLIPKTTHATSAIQCFTNPTSYCVYTDIAPPGDYLVSSRAGIDDRENGGSGQICIYGTGGVQTICADVAGYGYIYVDGQNDTRYNAAQMTIYGASASAGITSTFACVSDCSSATAPSVCTDPTANNVNGALPCTYTSPSPVCGDITATNYNGPAPCTYRTNDNTSGGSGNTGGNAMGPGYDCGIDGVCRLGSPGAYSTQSSCQAACVAPAPSTYTCYSDDWQCRVDPNGTGLWNNLGSCQTACTQHIQHPATTPTVQIECQTTDMSVYSVGGPCLLSSQSQAYFIHAITDNVVDDPASSYVSLNGGTQYSTGPFQGPTIVGSAPYTFTAYATGYSGGPQVSASLQVIPPQPPGFLVTAVKTTGGSIKSSDNFINCGATCTHTYTLNSSVTLNAIPSSSYWRFVNWSGDCSGSSLSCILTVNAAKTATAIFAPRPFIYKEF